MSFYTQGIDAQPESQNILEALLCNRAACNLELSTHLLLESNAKLFPIGPLTHLALRELRLCPP